jgi:hypothetical protein
MRPTLVAGVALACLFPARALAQQYYTAEELRDLARPVTASASALALGGTRGSGLSLVDVKMATGSPSPTVYGSRH